MPRWPPRSLFARLFATYAIAMALAAVGFFSVNLALRDNPLVVRYFINNSGPAAVAAYLIAERYESGGVSAAEPGLRLMENNTGLRLTLFGGDLKPIVGEPTSAMTEVARRTAGAGRPGEVLTELIELSSVYPIRTTNGKPYLLVGQVPGGLVRNLIFPVIRILTAVLAGLTLCYLLARALTVPLGRVRAAARRLAEGDLTARAGLSPPGTARTDEIEELGRDFDRMAERLEAASTGQRRLLADISHELRSPLARLNVALELARQKTGGAAEATFDRMERETGRMNDLIGELMTLSRLESGESGEREAITLSDLLRDVVSDADFEAKARGCQVQLTIEGEATVTGDRELLRRALENIARNAVRYTMEDTSVEIRLAGVPGRTVITCRDHGPGVPETALAHLFQPFYRVEDDRDRATGGVGLGLSIAERAVKLHGGTVRAENASDGGLRVTVELGTDVAL